MGLSDLNPVTLSQLHQHGLTSHAVLVVVDVVLIKERGHLHPVPPDGRQDLLHVVSADMQRKHVTT